VIDRVGSTLRSMRIGLVCPYSFDAPGGVQNHVLGLARFLRVQGHQPHILAPGDLSPRSDLHDCFTSAGAAVPVRYNGSVARVNFGPLSAARVRRWLRSQDFDLIHLHEPITPSISVLALWAAELPVVATFHTATPRSRSMQLAGGAMRAAIEKISAGIAVSESARQVVVQHLGRDAVIIPNGFAAADFEPRTPPTLRWRGGSRPRLAFLGRLDEPRKGLDVLMDALPSIRADVGALDVMIAGLGDRRLPATVRALGAISDPAKVSLLRSTDVFVAPHVARESFGIVLLEAMASGAPVVASDLPAFTDILDGGGAGALGQLFATGDPASLASAVSTVVIRPDAERTARAQRAARGYDWSKVGVAITEVYRATGVSPPPSPQRFEMADVQQLGWARGTQR